VLAWSRTQWGALPGLRSALENAGYEPVRHYDPRSSVRMLYEKPECRTP